MKYFDCIIVGAGPAGLLLAKELSKMHKVLVIEKNKIGETNKNWLTYKDRWFKEKFPKTFIENEFKEWSVQMKHGKNSNQFIIKDNFICFNEHKFLSWLAKICLKQKCTIKDLTTFNSFIRKKDKLIINKTFTTNLLIDCTGIDSKIIKKYNLIDLPIYINCFAYIGKFNHLKNTNYYCLYRNKNRHNYSSFGFTKIAPKLAQLQYFKYSNNRPNLKKYKEEMLLAQKDFRIPKHKLVELKIASYPTGLLKKRELDHIILFGDAGFYSPSLNGMGFNEILKQYKKVAKHISNCIKNNLYLETNLKLPDNIADNINNLLFRLLGLIINDIPQDVLNEIFTVINKLSQSDIKKIMRNDVTDKETIKIFKLFFKYLDLNKLIKSIQKHHAKYILKTIFELNNDIITEETHNLFFKHHKIRIKDMYN